MAARWIGAILIVLGCGGFGFSMAISYRKEIAALTQLQTALQIMHGELSCRMTPLPELFSKVAGLVSGCVSEVSCSLVKQMERQVSPDAGCCMQVVVKQSKDLPASVKEIFLELGRGLGSFDLDGQLMQLEAVKDDCSRRLEALNQQKEDRIRQYQTLGICVGAALAILLV